MIERRIETREELEVINVTAAATEVFATASTGVGHVFTPHTTAALIVSEDDPPDLRDDLKLVVREWLAGIGPFRHSRNNNPNTIAHVLSSFGGTQVAVPVEEGKLALGSYQNLLLIELDGPKTRLLRFAFAPTIELG